MGNDRLCSVSMALLGLCPLVVMAIATFMR